MIVYHTGNVSEPVRKGGGDNYRIKSKDEEDAVQFYVGYLGSAQLQPSNTNSGINISSALHLA